jgi:ABC-type multidrug transport system permease subunit
LKRRSSKPGKINDMNRKNISTAVIVALVIGTVLNLINSYDVFMEGQFTSKNLVRIILTYITPFCVSLYSSVKAGKQIIENDY